MLENIIPYLTNLTDKVLKAAFGTVSSVLIILSSFTGGNSAGINQSLNIDQKTLKELKILNLWLKNYYLKILTKLTFYC